jgi:uncharacterized protein (UPF0248 family)
VRISCRGLAQSGQTPVKDWHNESANFSIMMPIQDLLNRIRWDEGFGRADFLIGYYDRIEHSLVLKALADIKFPKDSHNVFEWNDSEGMTHTVPLHRIKAVYRNGELIWQRTH